MDSGRKRIPLGALSPSSARTGQRRRCSENDHSCPDVVENVDPNTTSGTGLYQHNRFSRQARDSKSNQNYTEGIHRFKPGIGSKLSGVIQKTLTPSQRRSRGVDLSGPSPPVFTSRLKNRRSKVQDGSCKMLMAARGNPMDLDRR
ncbi:hypothetical protein ACET3Z_028107 [Daucus carota]